MRKITFEAVLLAAVLMVSCIGGARPAFAAVTATVSVTENDNGQLQASVKMAGIEDCPTTGSVTIEFTSPNPKKFQSQSVEAPWRSCSKYKDDDGTSGTARTRARITVRRKSGDSVGTWKVTVKAGNTILATAEYKVE